MCVCYFHPPTHIQGRDQTIFGITDNEDQRIHIRWDRGSHRLLVGVIVIKNGVCACEGGLFPPVDAKHPAHTVSVRFSIPESLSVLL